MILGTILQHCFKKGAGKSCWCMAWQESAAEAKQRDGIHRRAQIKARVGSGTPAGLLGYLGGQPVAWCSITPRETSRRLRPTFLYRSGGIEVGDISVYLNGNGHHEERFVVMHSNSIRSI
jgi:hypothetical protein